MVIQTSLFDSKPTINDLYQAWKVDNLDLMRAFYRFADYAAKHGKRFGAKMITERLRWFAQVESHGDEYKVNNNYTSLMIRDWQRARPHWAHLVETRRLRSEEE